MKKILLISFLLFTTPAFAATDFSLDANCQLFLEMDGTGNETDQCNGGTITATETGGTIAQDTADYRTSTGSRVFLDDDTEYFEAADGTAIDISGASQDLSIGFWLKMDEGAEDRIFVNKFTTGEAGNAALTGYGAGFNSISGQFVFRPASSATPITVNSETTGNATTSGGNTTINAPSTISDDDVLVAIVGTDEDINTPTCPTSPVWVEGDKLTTSNGNDRAFLLCYRYVATAGGEPATYDFPTGATHDSAYWIASLTGVDTTTQEDEEMNNNLTEWGQGSAFSQTSVTDNAFVVAGWVIRTDTDVTMPGGDWATRAEDVLNGVADTSINVASKTIANSANKQYKIFYDFSNDAIVCEASGDGSNSSIAIPSYTDWDDGEWHKFDCVVDGNDIRVYHNGALSPAFGTNPIVYTSGIYDGNKDFYLGANGDDLSGYVSGHMDDLYLMDRALTADEVLEIRQDGFDGNGVERPSVVLLGSFVAAADDLDYYGGYTGLQTQGTITSLTGNYADRVTHQCIHDKGAFAGRTFTSDKSLLQPDYNHFMYFGIRGNTDDILCGHPSDRLEYGLIVNGTMATDSDWDMLGSPSTFTHTSSLALPLDTQDSYFVIAAENEGIQQGTLLIQGERGGHNTQWFGDYGTTGFIYVTSGQPYLKIEDPNGTLLDQPVGLHKNTWDDWRFQAGTLDSTYVGATTGTLGVYCSGGPCSFYLSNVRLGEVGYGSNYNPYEGLDDYNSGNEQYSVQGGWRVELIGKKWWIIDPFDNVYFNVGVNNYNFEDGELGKTVSHQGNTFCENMISKHGVGDCNDATALENPKYIEWGFNSGGSIIADINVYNGPAGATYDNWSPESPDAAILPYTTQSRMKRWNFTDVDEFIDMPAGAANDVWPDVYDPDWKAHFVSTGVSGAANWGCCNSASSGSEFRQIEGSQYDITPYKDSTGLGIGWINPWHKGFDLDEEPAGSGYGYDNYGFWIMTMDPDNSTASGTNYTKIYAINWLRAKYTDGGETTFVDNITYDGSDYLTDPDNWITVTGTVAGKDADALTNLNTSWGTTYTNWKSVWYEDDDDDTVTHTYDENAGFEASMDSVSTARKWNFTSTTGNIRDDLDEIQAEYYREHQGPFHKQTFIPMYHGNKINYGSGFGVHKGWHMGVTDRDGITKLVDIFYTHCGIGYDQNVISASDQDYGAYNAEALDMLGIPFECESGWQESIRDSDFGFSGVVDKMYKYSDVDYAMVSTDLDSGTDGWDCDAAQYASIASYCSATTATYRIPNYELRDVYWDCSDPTDTGTCTYSGDLWHMFIADVDQPYVNSIFLNKMYLREDSGSIMALVDNDVVTTGTLMFTMNIGTTSVTANHTTDTFTKTNHGWNNGDKIVFDASVFPTGISADTRYWIIGATDNTFQVSLTEGGGAVDFTSNGTSVVRRIPATRVEMLIDNDSDFDTEYNNPHAWDNYLNNVIVNDDDDTPASVQYMMIMQGYVTDRSITCYKAASEDITYPGCNETSSPGSQGYSCTWDCQLHIEAGDRYHNNYFPVTSSSYGFDSHYEIETQLDRARMYKHTGENFVTKRGISTNTGINHMMGFNSWEPISNRGFQKRGTSDHNGEGGSEGMRGWGWSDIMGNAYDGVEATLLGADGIPDTFDDARYDHGDFVTKAGAFQRGIYRSILPDRNKGNNANFNGVRFR